MHPTLRSKAALAAFVAILMPAALAAQEDPPTLIGSARNDGWGAIRTQQGCYVIVYKDRTIEALEGYNAPDLTIYADGGCGPDRLAEGPVRLQFKFTVSPYTYHYLLQFEGTAHAGLFQGDGVQTDADDRHGQLQLLDFSPNPMKLKLRDSCVVAYDPGNGQYVAPDPPDACDPAGAQSMIEQLRAAGLVGDGAGADAGAAASPEPARPVSAEAKGDVFGQCVQLVDEPDNGVHDDWSLRNTCSEPIIASYCFESDPPNISDKAQCAQGENRTTEIPGNGRIDFQYSMTDWGSTDLKQLQAVGYACAGGNFPDVYFEDRKLKFNGC